MTKKILFYIFILIITSGCSIYYVDSQNSSAEFYPAKKKAGEITYMENITQPHEIIGYVTINTERRQTIQDVIEKMKHEAAMMGGDAITGIKTDATGQWKKLPAQKLVGNAYVRENFTASVVVFK